MEYFLSLPLSRPNSLSLSVSHSVKWGARLVYHYSFHPFFCKFGALTCGAYAYWKGGTTQGRHRWSHPPRQWADNGKWKSKLKGCIQPHLAYTKGACRRQGVRGEGRGVSVGVEEHVPGHWSPSSAGHSITEVIETCWHGARHPSLVTFNSLSHW